LSKEARGLWRSINTEWELDQPAQLILHGVLQAFDRWREATAILNAQGLVVHERGQTKTHPAHAVERDSRQAVARGLKMLNIDIEPLNAAPGRPPGARIA
jgi:hypothetical protein